MTATLRNVGRDNLPADNVAAITVRNLVKAFYDVSGDRITLAATDVNFTVKRGEFVCIVGPSGCGKTTVLRILAGLEQPLSGQVHMDGGTQPAMVFQEASVLPWLTVAQNVALPLSLKGVSKARQRERVAELLSLTGLMDFADAHPHQLSGGMKQRVSVARALVDDRDILLMDEPFGALDALTRAHLQDELLRIVGQTRSTVVMVTHDVDEAVLLSDRIVMMSNGPAATVGDILTVELPRPRERLALANDPLYHQYRGAVLEFLYQRQRRPAA